MVLPHLLLLIGTVISFPTSPSDAMDALSVRQYSNNIQSLSGDITDKQVALIQAQMPPDITFSISRNITRNSSSDFSALVQASSETERVVGCVLPPPLPPNTDDCGFLIYSMGRVSSYTAPPRDGCFRYEYRSCFLFNCAGSCQAEGFQYEEWYPGLVQVMNSCVVGMGKGGFFESEGENGEAQGKTAGILHMGVLDLDYTIAPVFNMCVNEITTADEEF
jgi:hypothetical protein